MAIKENDKKRKVLPRVFTTLFTLLYLGWIFSNSLATAQQSGAASGEKHIVFYNPPVVNKQLGIRKSVLQETLHIASMLVDNNISTIVFGKSRLTVEVLTRHLKEGQRPVRQRGARPGLSGRLSAYAAAGD